MERSTLYCSIDEYRTFKLHRPMTISDSRIQIFVDLKITPKHDSGVASDIES